MALKNIPSTSPHKLSAERVAKVTKALAKILVQKGVLQPPPAQTPPAQPEKPKQSDDRHRRTIVLDCRDGWAPYLELIEGGKSDTDPTAAPSGKVD
jgi:hypothetical protein